MKRATENGRDRAEVMAKSAGEKTWFFGFCQTRGYSNSKPNSTRDIELRDL